MMRESIQRARYLFRTLTQRRLDALDLLEGDHIRVELLFLRWRFTSEEAQLEHLFESIKHELLKHSHLEESIFYPACDKVHELKKWMPEVHMDHKRMKSLLKEMTPISKSDKRVKDKMKVLMGLVSKHVSFEENILFPRVRTLMRKPALDRMNRELRLAKQNKVQKIAA